MCSTADDSLQAFHVNLIAKVGLEAFFFSGKRDVEDTVRSIHINRIDFVTHYAELYICIPWFSCLPWIWKIWYHVECFLDNCDLLPIYNNVICSAPSFWCLASEVIHSCPRAGKAHVGISTFFFAFETCQCIPFWEHELKSFLSFLMLQEFTSTAETF